MLLWPITFGLPKEFIMLIEVLKRARLSKSLLFLASIVGLVLTSTASVEAHGVADQINDPQSNLQNFACSSAGPSLFQSFSPTARRLVGVDLRLQAGGSLPLP